MSQLATARPLPRTAPVPGAAGRRLRVVAGVPRQGNAAFVALCLSLLVAGLVAVLLLNTSIAQGSFVLRDLQDRSNALADAEDALGHAIDAQSTPAVLARRALERGMVPASSPAFLRLEDGAVIGVAEPARADNRFSVVAQAAAGTPPGSPADRDTEATTTVTTTSGSVTTTTVTVTRGDSVERTVTSVDGDTGAVSTSTTASKRAPAAASVRYR
ncbi:MAG TPA: hypothetical protein VES95_02800 [Dermatophilaceae bacterium]|nr:hypothetical protein [Dermatophilaceae bacterium]